MKQKDSTAPTTCPLSRRSFLKNSALATAALTVSPSALFADVLKPASSKSIVAICENLKAITESYQIDSRRVREMVDEGIKTLTDTKTIKEGWLKIFPDLKILLHFRKNYVRTGKNTKIHAIVCMEVKDTC